MHSKDIKQKVINLRQNGKTYGEIKKELGLDIPKSTLSDWCKNILLSQLQKEKIEIAQQKNAKRGMEVAWLINKIRREKYLKSVDERIEKLAVLIKNKDIAKIAAALLYLGEGSKVRKGSLMLGNSDPQIIKLFLYLLRHSYNINESKFRCTVQCRADQNIKELENFWSKTTGIPHYQFYASRIDPRTIGKPSKKPNYKGVCRLEYFSADLFIEIVKIGKLMYKGL